MSGQKRFLCQVNSFKVYLQKTMTINQTKAQTFILSINNSQNGSKYSSTFRQYSDMPQSAQNLFSSHTDFIKALEGLLTDKSLKDQIFIDQNLNMNIKLDITIGKVQTAHLIKIEMFQTQDNFQKLLQRINQLQKKMCRFLEYKSPQNKPRDVVHYENPILQEKQPKKKLKQNKQNQKLPVNKDATKKNFIIQENRVTFLEEMYKIQALLIKKQNLMSISVSIFVYNTSLTYTGQLNDVEISQFLYAATKIKNSRQLFEQIKRNAKKQNKQTLKVNEKQNKLEILIVMPSSKQKLIQTGNQKEESIFAQIDIKPIKQQPQQETRSSSSKLNNKERQIDFDKKSLSQSLSKNKIIDNVSQTLSKNKIIDNVRSSVLNGKKGHRNIDLQKPGDKSQKSPKIPKNNSADSQKALSQISFKTKKSSTTKHKGTVMQGHNTTLNQNSLIGQPQLSADLSLSLSYSKKNLKSSRGFLINKMHGCFFMRQKSLQLKFSGMACALLAKKIPKKGVDFQFMIRIKKISELFIVGIGSQEIGNQNTYLHQYFIGYSPLNAYLYECASFKHVTNHLKELKENSVIKVRVNIKNQLITWLLKNQDITIKEEWRTLKEILIPHFMQLKNLYPTVFMNKAQDKVEFVSSK